MTTPTWNPRDGSYITTFHTFTGLTFAELLAEMDRELPPTAYSRIPGAVDLTDIDPGCMQEALNQILGPHGHAWGVEFDPDHLIVHEGERESEAYIKQGLFWYRLIGPDGQPTERLVFPVTGGSNNRAGNMSYTLKGALTNLIGHGAFKLGFQSSVYKGERSHATVGKKKASAPTGPGKPASAPAGPAPEIKPVPVPPAPTPLEVPTVAGDQGDYVLKVSRSWKGKQVKDLPPAALVWFADEMAAMGADAAEARTACQAYLQAHPEVRAAALEPAAAVMVKPNGTSH